MPWHAISTLDDARRATTSLLLPVDPGRWLRLALVAFFVGGLGGGSGGGGGGQGTVDVSTDQFPTGFPGDVPFDVPPTQTLFALVATVVAVALLFGLLYLAVGSVMEFVFVEGVTSRDVRLREPFRANVRPGLRLFVFRLLVGVLVAVLVAVPIAGAVLGGIGVSPAFFLLLLPVVLVVVFLAILGGIVLQLTTDFVVPTMLAEDRGVLDAWRRVLPLLRAEWQQAALYVIVRYVLAIGAAIAVGLVVLLLALVVALPFVLVGGVVYLVGASMGGPGLVGWALLGLVGALYGLVVVVVSLFVQVPVVTYFRYYALFVLGELDASLDLVASVRAGVRE